MVVLEIVVLFVVFSCILKLSIEFKEEKNRRIEESINFKNRLNQIEKSLNQEKNEKCEAIPRSEENTGEP